MLAYVVLTRLKSGDRSGSRRAEFEQRKAEPGYGLLLKKYAPSPAAD